MSKSFICFWCMHFMCDRCTGKRNLDDRGECFCATANHPRKTKPDELMEL